MTQRYPLRTIMCCLLLSLAHLLQQNGVLGLSTPRRQFLSQLSTASTSFLVVQFSSPLDALAASSSTASSIGDLRLQLVEARKQMAGIPSLIEKEQWDSVRAALITPPLVDCWGKTSRPLVTKFADALGETGGDELAALEAREDLVSHLRYLDMAVYNNVFNPITVEGKSGATKELVRSYYEDPMNEYKASVAALESLLSLSPE